MGDRANVYVEMPAPSGDTAGVYLYTHYHGHEWPEMLREALLFGRGHWTDDQYLARIITSRMFLDLASSEVGGGLSLRICDNSYPIIICDLSNRTVSFADEGDETDPGKRHHVMSFEEYVDQAKADYPDRDGR